MNTKIFDMFSTRSNVKKLLIITLFVFSGTAVRAQEAVDMGLSVKWASCNVGASKPEEFGAYYAWGELEEKADYTQDNYKWCDGTYDKLNKYNDNPNFGNVDGKTVLDPEDDVATVKLGKGWRTPTLDELIELKSQCKWKNHRMNGVDGWLVTAPNGNKIFFPYAGNKYNGKVVKQGMGGMYHCSTINKDNAYAADGFYCLSGRASFNVGLFRFYGRPVRAVKD